MARVRVLSGREVCRILASHSFIETRRRGSHIVMQKIGEMAQLPFQFRIIESYVLTRCCRSFASRPTLVRIRMKVAEPAVKGFPEVSSYRDSEELAVETGSDPIEVCHETISSQKADQPDRYAG